MNKLSNLITSLVVATWLGIVPVFSIQNISPVSLRIATFESIKIPVGVLLSFSAGAGMVLGGLLPLFSGNGDNNN